MHMDNAKPLKRSGHLKPLSRGHHHGLLLCWKIREGFKRNVDPERIERYANWCWYAHLASHFGETDDWSDAFWK